MCQEWKIYILDHPQTPALGSMRQGEVEIHALQYFVRQSKSTLIKTHLSVSLPPKSQPKAVVCVRTHSYSIRRFTWPGFTEISFVWIWFLGLKSRIKNSCHLYSHNFLLHYRVKTTLSFVHQHHQILTLFWIGVCCLNWRINVLCSLDQ